VQKTGKRALAQRRGTSLNEATICHCIESFITCSGAYPGLRLETDPGKRLIIKQKA